MSPESKFNCLLLVVALTAINTVRLLFFQHELLKYLRKNHFDKWKELTTIFGSGPGMNNSKRSLKFILRDNEINTPECINYKTKCRNTIVYITLGIVAIFIMAVIVGDAWTKK